MLTATNMDLEAKRGCLAESGKEQQGRPAQSEEEKSELLGKSILLVDDTPEVLDVLKYFLIRAGFDVVSSRTAWDALEACQTTANRFGLLVTDIQLGNGTTGQQLAEALLELNPKLSVVYMSGARADLWDPSSFVEGVNYLPKPFSPSSLVKMATERLHLGVAERPACAANPH